MRYSVKGTEAGNSGLASQLKEIAVSETERIFGAAAGGWGNGPATTLRNGVLRLLQPARFSA